MHLLVQRVSMPLYDLTRKLMARCCRATFEMASGVFTIVDKYKCRDTKKINFMLPMLEKA
jgi:hypothetical protein